MNRKYNIQLNLSPYANYYAVGGNTDFKEVLEEENPEEFNRQLETQKDNKFLNFMNGNGGGGWANAIMPAVTNAVNALNDTEASTAERVATAMGIPALAKIWTADTTAGDANLKAMQSNIDTFAKQNLIQDASSTFGANNAVKLNNKFIAPVPMTGVKDLSWKDFRGNMFKKGAAATLQGAAAGSVGGPWGALGGAIVGLGSSLFGGIGAKGRAKKAYADYQNKMATLTSQANSMYKQALNNQTLSNMQALANGNMSQRINDMANIRAYGGNLYPDGGSIIDPDPETITADDIEKARLDSYYPNRLSDTFLGQPVGYLSEDAGLESYAPIIGTVQDWDKFTAEPTVGNAIWAGLSTIGDIPWLKIGGIGLRALKRGLDAYNTYGKVTKALNKAKAVGEFGEAADALRNLRKVMPDPEYTQIRRKIIAPTRDKDVIEGVRDYYKYEGAKLANQLGKELKKPLTYSDFAINFAQNQVGGGNNYIPEDKKILSNNGVVFSYNPSSRTWISENSGSKGEKIVVPAEEMEQNLQNGLGKIIEGNTKAIGGNLYSDGGGDLTDEQQMVLADIQADPRILFTPKYSQWRDYIRRTSPDYLDRLYTSLPYEQQQDIYQNDREAWGALSNEAKGNFGGAQVRKKTDEVSPYVAGALGLVGAAPAWEAVTMFPMLENGLNAYFGYESAKNLPTAVTDTYDYAKKGDWSRAGLSAGEAVLDGWFIGNGISAVKNTAKEVLPVVKGKYRQNKINSTTNKAESEISDKDWDIAYNAAIKANDMVKAQRLRDAHFLEKAGNDVISKNGHPEIMYHSVDPMYDSKFNSFDTNIEGRKTFVYTTNNKNMSRSYTKGQEFNKDMYRPAAEMAADAAIAENRNGLLTREQLIDKYIKEFSKGLESKANTTKELYGKLNNPWIIEGNYHNWDNIPTRFPEYNEIVPVERSTREVEDLIQINNEIGNKKYDGAIMNNISDWGSTYLQPERDIFTLNTLEPTVKPNPDFYGTVYSFENPKNLKYRDAITYDDAGNIIPLSKRDNFNTNDLRYGLIPFLGLTGYGLTNNTEYAMGGNLYTDLSPNMMSLWNNKQQIDQQKAMNQQFSLGLGNTAFTNQFAGGGKMTSADVPENMQYYANGGTHEENPYGGIQVGVDQQGTPNLTEEGEFKWNDFVFSDRINVDANLLSSFNLAPATKHQNKKAAKGKLSYADMAKKYAKRNKELENDPITKNSMEAFMQRLANAQEYQKKEAQLEAQKQNELQDYKTALNKQNNNPMYGTMKYNGMGNASTQQGVNSGVDAGMGNPMSNADLSNVNRSGNEMMAAYGGNLFAIGGDEDPYPYYNFNFIPSTGIISVPFEWGENAVIPDRGIRGNRNWQYDNYLGNTVYKSNFNSKTDTRPSYIIEKNPNSIAPAVSTYTWNGYDGLHLPTPENLSKFEQDTGAKLSKRTLYPNGLKALNNNEYFSQLERDNPTNLILPTGTSWGLPQNNSNEGLNLGVGTSQQPTDVSNADAQYTYKTGDEGTTGRQGLTGNINVSDKVIDKTTPNTNPDAAVPSDPKEAPLYSTAGKYAQFGKGIMPMVWDWANKTNVKYDPYQRDADRLEALANEGPVLRTADTIGGYRAPNLMDVERLNNSARAEGLAQMQAILDAANGNRGFVGAQSAQNNYNTQMGIGDNYVKIQEANNANRLQTDQFNHAIDVANQNAINTMRQDNQRAEQAQHQAALSGTAQAAAMRQRERLHADEVNTERMKNRAANQAAAVDNALNYFTTQAMENQELNTRNNDPTNPYWIDKRGVTHYTGDSGLTQAIRDEFGDDKYGRNGTFTGERLTEWNNLTKKYKAKDLKEHPELWRHLVAQQREANRIDAEKANQARMEELEALRGTYQSNLARLNALRDSGAIISDPSYNLYTGWADEDYSGNQGLLRSRNQALDQYITQIGNNYDRYLYEKQLAQNQAKALGGYLNDGQNNNNYYYSYTRI